MSRRRKPCGFTLLEAVVALAILGVTAVGALAAVGSELRTAGHARRALQAQALAEQRLAVLRLLGPRELQPLTDSLARGRFSAPFTDYQWRASIQRISDEDDLFDLRVCIEWEGGAYALRSRLYRPAPVVVPR